MTEKSKSLENTYIYKNNNLFKNSFQITYVLLLTTATITFIEAIRTNNAALRHILNLETCISLVACYFYSIFIVKVADYNPDLERAEALSVAKGAGERLNSVGDSRRSSFDWKEITQIRYIDWSITTPMMLLSLCLILSMNTTKSVNIFKYLIIVILNYTMLYLGYIGEIGIISRMLSFFLGFIAFFALFYFIFINYLKNSKSQSNYVIFLFYVAVWSMYGIVFLLPEETKNTITNFLDLIAKCFGGISIWVYYTGIITN
jgi:bacteriorhodopsin